MIRQMFGLRREYINQPKCVVVESFCDQQQLKSILNYSSMLCIKGSFGCLGSTQKTLMSEVHMSVTVR